jgi:hypothetical protein
LLGLLLQMIEIQSIGQRIHRNTSVHDIAEGPQYRLHKGCGCRSKAASGFNPSRGPGSGLHRICYNIAGAGDGQRAGSCTIPGQKNPGRMASGRDQYC